MSSIQESRRFTLEEATDAIVAAIPNRKDEGSYGRRSFHAGYILNGERISYPTVVTQIRKAMQEARHLSGEFWGPPLKRGVSGNFSEEQVAGIYEFVRDEIKGETVRARNLRKSGITSDVLWNAEVDLFRLDEKKKPL